VANRLLPKLQTIPGLVDVSSNYKQGKPEFQVKMDPLKMEKLGVPSVTAGMELRGMVEGIKSAKFREDGLEYDIRVRLEENQRDLSNNFELIYVPNVNHQLVKLKNIADPVKTVGPSKIYRRNRSRYVMISGNLGQNGAIGNITSAAEKIIKQEKLPEGVTYEFLGASEDMADLFKNMLIAAGLSIVFIYLVLASLYESVFTPFTIMLALPLAIVGGLFALFLAKMSIDLFTMIGFIMLLGLVTKNSILLVDYTQKLMRRGMERNEALVKAGLTRLRPILMTTFALIAGMLPLAMGLTEVGKFRQGMAIVIIGGLISSTILTLVVIPAVYGFMDTLRLRARKLVGRPPDRVIDKDIA
ncbi:MAG: efflux RND transporter permease subunit, partial [bacterium]